MTVITQGSSSGKFPPPTGSARTTMSEQAYYRIKRMIATGELLPGTQLVLRSLAATLGYSRTPIIEAIRRLERDGLVTVQAKWGAAVRQWSREEILEAYAIRRGLEGEAARQFVMHASPQDKQRLIELGAQFDELASSDPVRCEEVDMELHLHIARATGFRRLFELIENSKIETATLFGLATRLPANDARYSQSIGSHDAVVQALVGEDPEAATRAMWAHIDTVLSKILSLEE